MIEQRVMANAPPQTKALTQAKSFMVQKSAITPNVFGGPNTEISDQESVENNANVPHVQVIRTSIKDYALNKFQEIEPKFDIILKDMNAKLTKLE